jgi:hypothetical protein
MLCSAYKSWESNTLHLKTLDRPHVLSALIMSIPSLANKADWRIIFAGFEVHPLGLQNKTFKFQRLRSTLELHLIPFGTNNWCNKQPTISYGDSSCQVTYNQRKKRLEKRFFVQLVHFTFCSRSNTCTFCETEIINPFINVMLQSRSTWHNVTQQN